MTPAVSTCIKVCKLKVEYRIISVCRANHPAQTEIVSVSDSRVVGAGEAAEASIVMHQVGAGAGGILGDIARKLLGA